MKISVKLTLRYICRSQFLGSSPIDRNAIQSLNATNANINLSSVLANKKKTAGSSPAANILVEGITSFSRNKEQLKND